MHSLKYLHMGRNDIDVLELKTLDDFMVWDATVCFLLHEGSLDRILLLKANSERLKASMS